MVVVQPQGAGVRTVVERESQESATSAVDAGLGITFRPWLAVALDRGVAAGSVDRILSSGSARDADRTLRRLARCGLSVAALLVVLAAGALPEPARAVSRSGIVATTGSQPVAIVADAAGNVYTANRRSNNVSVVTPQGVSRILGVTGAEPRAITIDADGNVYTANWASDDVTKITPDGVSRIVGRTGAAPSAIAVDAAGNVYTVTTTRIGPGIVLTPSEISMLTPAGELTIFSASRGDFWVGNEPSAIATDEAGNLLVADAWMNAVLQRGPDGAVTVRGTTGQDPRAIAVQPNGSVFTFNAGSKDVTRIAPDGTTSVYGRSGPGRLLGSGPGELAVDARGNVYVATDRGVAKFTPCGVGEMMRRGPSTGVTVGKAGRVYTADSGADTVVQVPTRGSIIALTGDVPVDLATDAMGRLYTANLGSNSVTRIAAPSGLRCSPSITLGATGKEPTALAVDRAGSVFTTNMASWDVTKITAAGETSRLGYTALGPSGMAPGPDGTPFFYMGGMGIALDRAGNVYASNTSYSNSVSRITPTGATEILGTTGASPFGIAVAADGSVYTANSSDGTVSRITADGSSSVLGTVGARPEALAIDAAGNVYTANVADDTVSKLTPDGVSRILGTTGRDPSAIAIDRKGNVYTTNRIDDTVSKITPNGVSTIVGRTGDGPSGIVLGRRGVIYTSNDLADTVTRLVPTTDVGAVPLRIHALDETASGLELAVEVPARGSVSFAATTAGRPPDTGRSTRAAAELSVCESPARTTAHAERVSLSCSLRPAIVNRLRRHALMVTVTATFTPRRGSAQTATTTIQLRRRPGSATVVRAIETVMEFSGPGVARQTGTIRHQGRTRTVCLGAKRIAAAGPARLSCYLTPEAVELSESLELRVSIETVFTPDGGGAETRHELIELAEADLPATTPPPAAGGVTG